MKKNIIHFTQTQYIIVQYIIIQYTHTQYIIIHNVTIQYTQYKYITKHKITEYAIEVVIDGIRKTITFR